jgi:hypothetical protein
MAGYIGTKAVNLSTTGADINGDANIDGSLTAAAVTGTTGQFDTLEIASSNPNIQLTDTDDNGYSQIRHNSGSLIIEADKGETTASSAIRFDVDNSEALRIDASGNVGIGTSTIAATLHVNSGASNLAGLFESDDAGATITLIDDSTTGGSAADHGLNAVGDQLELRAVDNLSFETAGSEAVHIDSSGNVGIGTSTQTSSSAFGCWMNPVGQFRSSRNSTSSVTQFVFSNPNGQIGAITTSGSSTAYNTSSDYRLKEDWTPMSGASERVQLLKPVNFAWKVDASRVDGFLAHELAEVIPEAVYGAKDAMQDEEYEVTPAVLDEDGNETSPAVMATRSVPDMQGIDQSKIVPLLTAALQEALTKIADLETRLIALEGTA